MPELCRFGGMIIYLFFEDKIHTSTVTSIQKKEYLKIKKRAEKCKNFSVFLSKKVFYHKFARKSCKISIFIIYIIRIIKSK